MYKQRTKTARERERERTCMNAHNRDRSATIACFASVWLLLIKNMEMDTSGNRHNFVWNYFPVCFGQMGEKWYVNDIL